MTTVTTSAPTALVTKEFTINPVQGVGTYDLATATGDISIRSAKLYVGTAITGLVSLAVQSNNTTAIALVTAAEGAVAGLTGDKNVVSAFVGPALLVSGKKLQYSIVGTGTAGTAKLVVEYAPATSGAVLA